MRTVGSSYGLTLLAGEASRLTGLFLIARLLTPVRPLQERATSDTPVLCPFSLTASSFLVRLVIIFCLFLEPFSVYFDTYLQLTGSFCCSQVSCMPGGKSCLRFIQQYQTKQLELTILSFAHADLSFEMMKAILAFPEIQTLMS